MTAWTGPVDLDLAVELPQEAARPARASAVSADEGDGEPALDADPGAQPAPQVHRPLELAMEDRDRPELVLPEPRRELLGEDDRAVVAAGAADGDRQPRPAVLGVGRDGKLQQLLDELEEAAAPAAGRGRTSRTPSVRPDRRRSSGT